MCCSKDHAAAIGMRNYRRIKHRGCGLIKARIWLIKQPQAINRGKAKPGEGKAAALAASSTSLCMSGGSSSGDGSLESLELELEVDDHASSWRSGSRWAARSALASGVCSRRSRRTGRTKGEAPREGRMTAPFGRLDEVGARAPGKIRVVAGGVSESGTRRTRCFSV